MGAKRAVCPDSGTVALAKEASAALGYERGDPQRQAKQNEPVPGRHALQGFFCMRSAKQSSHRNRRWVGVREGRGERSFDGHRVSASQMTAVVKIM